MPLSPEAVLVAAADLETDGEEATPDAIAGALGLPTAEVRALLPDRAAVLDALGPFAVRRLAAAVEAAGPEALEPVPAVHRLVRELIPEGALILHLLDELPWWSPATKARWDAALLRIDEPFQRGQDRGLFSADLPGCRLSEYLLEPLTQVAYEVREGSRTREEAAFDLAARMVAFAADPRCEDAPDSPGSAGALPEGRGQ